MADSTISALTAAAALVGTEAIPIAQSTSTVRTTVQDIANLASATSAKINTVSNALSNLISLHDVLSNRVSANSAVGAGFLASALNSAATSVQGAQSVVNVLSDRISAAWDHAAIASAAATSADGHANAVSVDLATLSLAVSALEVRVSTLSSLPGGGLTSAQVGAMVLSLVSCTSAEVQVASAAATSADGHANTVSIAAAAADAHASAASAALSLAISALQTSIQTASAAATSADGHANTVSVAAAATSLTLVSVQSTVSHLASIVSLVSTVSGAGTAVGLQSVINALSVRIVAGASATSAEVQVASAAATSADGHANTVSVAVAALSLNVTSVMSTVSHLASIVSLVSTVSGAGTAVGLQSVINALSNRISGIVAGGGITSDAASAMIASVASTMYSAKISVGATASVKGIQSAFNAHEGQFSQLKSVVSNALSAGDVISANVANLNSIVSLISTQSAVAGSVVATAVGMQSVVNALSNRLSLQNLPPNAANTHAAVTRRVLSTAGAVIASAALADVTGMSVSVKSGGIYQLLAMLMLTRGGAATVHGFGLTYPAMTQCRGKLETHVSTSQSIFVAGHNYRAYFDGGNSGNILVSVSASQGAKLSVLLQYEALMVPSANGVVQIQAKAAGGTSAISVCVGSFIQVTRIN